MTNNNTKGNQMSEIEKYGSQLLGRQFGGRARFSEYCLGGAGPVVDEVLSDRLLGSKVIEHRAFGEVARADHVVDTGGTVSDSVEHFG